MSILVGPETYYQQPRSFNRSNAMTHNQWNAYANTYANQGLGGRAFERQNAMPRSQWDAYANAYANHGPPGRTLQRQNAFDYRNAPPPAMATIPRQNARRIVMPQNNGIPRQDARRFNRYAASISDDEDEDEE